jgi:hypothetical protein
MLDATWIVSFIAGPPLICAGILAVKKAPGSTAASSFLIAMVLTFVAMMTGHGFEVLDRSQADLSTALVRIYVAALLLTLMLLSLVSLVYPFEREVRFRPPNVLGVGVALAVILSIVGGSFARPEFGSPVGTSLTRFTGIIVLIGFGTMFTVVTASTLVARSKVAEYARHSSTLYMVGLWMVAVTGSTYSVDMIVGHKHDPSLEDLPSLLLIVCIIFVSLLYALSVARGRMSIGVTPAPEKLKSGFKAKHMLLRRRAYLVEEEKPDFAITLFADTLRGRCFDCEDDESFSCESSGCATCGLPCPCRSCKKYRSRPQGLVVTRQFPNDIRKKYFLRTTPILWLTTVPGNESVDPSKLSILTDYVLRFMEESENGIVLIDGIEYLISSNDFHRVLKAIEMWTETAMVSETRLILSVDSRAYEKKDLAVLEGNRVIMRPEATESTGAE